MNEQKGTTTWIIWVNRIAITLVSLLAIGAFVLSYNALHEVAKSHNIPAKLAWIWPLLIDGSIVVFSIAVVRASLLRESARWPWGLVIVFTVGTIFFNVLHFVPIPNPKFVSVTIAIIAPVGLVLAFETVMGMLKSNVARKEAVQSIAEIEAESKKKRLELDNLEQARLAEIEAQTRAKQAELDSLLLTRQNELDKVGQELETIQGQITQAQTELADILGQVEGQKAGQKDKDIPIVIIGEGLDLPKMKPAERQKYLPQLINGGVDKDRILDIFGISAKTLDRDIKECNGAIMDPADIPFMAGGRNGNHRKAG